jgi:hypothetical protein
MGDRDDGSGPDDRHRGGREGGHGDRGRGPGGPAFLDLEISKVMFGEASELAREAGRELLKESLKARLRERFGARIEAIAAIAVDELMEDLEANLAIEARIGARVEARRSLDQRIAEALRAPTEKRGKPRR